MVNIGTASYLGGNHFRVEEYRKPEFEVTVEPGKDLARLGEKVSARIKATYLFGAPVADARVTYRIYREDYTARYVPPGPWDWLYGPGYGWCFYAYPSYPWWFEWGCKRWVPWIPWQPERELSGEGQGRLDADGSIEATIDSAPALRDHPDSDHRYTVVAEVTDASRRTLSGEGSVIVTHQEFEAFVDVDRGYYLPDEEMAVTVKTMTATQKPVAVSGQLTVARVLARGEGGASAIDKPETVQTLTTDADGHARLTLRTRDSGQLLVRFETKDSRGKPIFGSALVWVAGAGFTGESYRMNDVEILTDRRSYAPGELARVLLHANQPGAHVLFSARTDNGTLLDYRIITLSGKSATVDVPVGKGDVPNFFMEATTVFQGGVHQEVREVLVPPQESVVDLRVAADKEKVKPGSECRLALRASTPDGKPARAQIALAVFDRAVLQIQPEITPDIRKWFWGDRRSHSFQMETNLRRSFHPTAGRLDPRSYWPGGLPEDWDGGFGNRWLNAETAEKKNVLRQLGVAGGVGGELGLAHKSASGAADELAPASPAAEPPESKTEESRGRFGAKEDLAKGKLGEAAAGELKGATVRKTFADTALFIAALDSGEKGEASVTVPFPQNLTTWRVKALAMTAGTRVGEAVTSVVTTKDFIVRLAAPRFFTERDTVVLSANVRNGLASAKKARVSLALPADLLDLGSPATVTVDVPSKGEKRVDWTVKVKKAGLASIKVEALTDEESDATEMAFPVLVHGTAKTVSYTGAIRAAGPARSEVKLEVPAERRAADSALSVRVSPSLGLAMLDALPYLIQYPYGCTEQTMSRFMPAVLTMKTLEHLGVSLADLEKHQTNLNAQQIGPHRYDPKDPDHPAVFSEKELQNVVRASLKRIGDMQRPDGGWGWWADDEPSTYLTAYVTWGLLEARDADVSIDASMLSRGLQALQGAVRRDVADFQEHEWIGNEQAWLLYVLTRARKDEIGDAKLAPELASLLFDRRIQLSLYGKALLSLSLRRMGDAARADLVLENARQKEQRDNENGTVFYPTETNGWWWWWNNDVESQAWVLRAIVAKDPRDEAAPGLVKWLLGNRKNGTYWRSTRDTAVAVAAFADYVKATREDEPDMTVRILLDGKVRKEMRITKQSIFTFDNTLALEGEELTTGSHTLAVERQGKGSVYWNAELSYFTLEEGVKAAGLEIKVARSYSRLVREDATVTVPGARLEAVSEKRVRYRRVPLADGDQVTSGDLLEVELRLTSKNDYDYLVFEDPKPAGCEPVEVRSGARFGELCSNMELRDEKVAFFVGWLDRGDHLIRYRLRAEAPGTFHTLPTKGFAMYAPELRCNADEIRIQVQDREP